jgi:DNA-binding transcriptional ArsR family regulator
MNRRDGPSQAFKALGHPFRLRVLDYVRERATTGRWFEGTAYWVAADERTCHRELAAKFDVPLSTLAHHLRLLIDAGVLRLRKERGSILFGVDDARLAELGAFLTRASMREPAASALRDDRVVILNDVKPTKTRRPISPAPHALYAVMYRAKLRYFGGRGGVDYWGLARSPEFAECQRLVWGLREFDIERLGDGRTAMVFWLNLYNLLYLHAVVALGIERSVNEIQRVFGNVAYAVGGHVFSAADIEHGLLRCNRTASHRPQPQFKRSDPRLRFMLKRLDPRVYFALVCGTRSCPPLGAYSEDLLNSQLDAAAAAYVNAEVQLMEDERAIVLPMMLQWYRKDFEEYPGGLLAFLLRYLPADERRRALESNPTIELRFKEWDWRLNTIEA